MPYLETPDDLADYLADAAGVYGGHTDGEERECRVCFTDKWANRIREAVRNEEKLHEVWRTRA